jgi:leucyl aminopeptidase
MNFTAKSSNPLTLSTECLVTAVFEDGSLPDIAAIIDKATRKSVSRLVSKGDIKGKKGESLLLQKTDGVRAQRILLVGAGKQKELDAKKYAALVSATGKLLEKHGFADATIALADLPVKDTGSERKGELLARIFSTLAYRYSTTKARVAKSTMPARISVLLSDTRERAATAKGLARGAAIGKGMNTARELGNLPGNICTPTFLGEQAQQLAAGNRKLLKAKVLTEAQMKRLGMHSLLSVGKGSEEPSALIIMEYRGAAATQKPNVLVGKGITFDSGGISLKPGAAMDEMKFDMCGAASVLGVMTALCELKPKINVVGVIASAENMPSGKANKPGDIVTSMSKQTIEILNTDAEGRLVLCDALTYIDRYKPKTVIDIATLTGACITALGSVVSGMMSNDDNLADTLYQCGLDAQDPCWRLPIWEEYQQQLDSNFADIANIGGPKAGAITAGCFLARFTKSYKWAHLDIAGTAWLQGSVKGATGRPIPLLMEYLLNH